MYAVVGCTDCSALWVVEGRPDTTNCPRCGTRRTYSKLKEFVTTDDPDHAKEVRASMLAARQGHSDAFGELDSFAEMEAAIDEAGPDDETYLDAHGIDPAAVEAAGTGATEGDGSKSRKEIVLAALDDLDSPDRAAIVAYASERGVPESYVERALEKLVRAGEVTERDGGYRRL